jgi:hypothetical protein
MTCNFYGKVYGAGQLTGIAGGHGKSPVDIYQEQKGGFSLFRKRSSPAMFGGKEFT